MTVLVTLRGTVWFGLRTTLRSRDAMPQPGSHTHLSSDLRQDTHNTLIGTSYTVYANSQN
jgi:hypothetical protein